MKKFILSITCSLFALLSFTLITPSTAEAASQVPDSRIVSEYFEQLEDGSYFHVIISEELTSSVSRSIQTKTGSRKITFYNADGTALWVFTLHGTFQYIPGSSATCTSSSYTINIYDDSWENTAASTTTSGNQAIGDATFIKKVLFITTNIENVHATLTCSAYGTLS